MEAGDDRDRGRVLRFEIWRACSWVGRGWRDSRPFFALVACLLSCNESTLFSLFPFFPFSLFSFFPFLFFAWKSQESGTKRGENRRSGNRFTYLGRNSPVRSFVSSFVRSIYRSKLLSSILYVTEMKAISTVSSFRIVPSYAINKT